MFICLIFCIKRSNFLEGIFKSLGSGRGEKMPPAAGLKKEYFLDQEIRELGDYFVR
jgi:hypothetical protein